MTFDELHRRVSEQLGDPPSDQQARDWITGAIADMQERAITTAMADYRCSHEVAVEILRHRDYSNPSCAVPD